MESAFFEWSGAGENRAKPGLRNGRLATPFHFVGSTVAHRLQCRSELRVQKSIYKHPRTEFFFPFLRARIGAGDKSNRA